MHEILSLVVVAFLWGATNPFLRQGSAGIERVHSDSKITGFILELKFLVTRWQYIVPFLLNQSGSLLYFFTLQKTALSVAVPIANSLSFVFTALVAQLLGERAASKNVILGTILVAVGSILCLIET
ncbi:transmembrane protein 234 homolog [Hermetia illucens]|uniref:transmembrane protein 234 homolog n=1 Tax=Hermetia illucens TaxID=343691 RepID=UPI0018CC5935|nr:transmembrane protein 234 homolog [Hermetia illucens]